MPFTAADQQIDDGATLLVTPGQPLIVLPFQIDGRQLERYFADEKSAGGAVSDGDLRVAMDAIGAVKC